MFSLSSEREISVKRRGNAAVSTSVSNDDEGGE